jgi:NurA-like 5'-3' nuclease
MDKLKQFIEENFERFINLDESEVHELDAHYLDNDLVNYLKDNDRFDYKGICVYYVKESDEVWIENMDADEEE